MLRDGSKCHLTSIVRSFPAASLLVLVASLSFCSILCNLIVDMAYGIQLEVTVYVLVPNYVLKPTKSSMTYTNQHVEWLIKRYRRLENSPCPKLGDSCDGSPDRELHFLAALQDVLIMQARTMSCWQKC